MTNTISFSPDETLRYQRHLSLEGFGPAGQEKLRRGSVLVIGAGGLGCPALLYLAAAGVGRIVIVDDDKVDLSNLQRQVLYSSSDAGRPKAEAAAERLSALNPLITVVPLQRRFTRENAIELVSSCDIVVDGSDNFGTRYLVNDACVLADRPFVFGAIQGFEGQVSVFNWKGGPTYRCLFPEPPPAGTVPNCAEAGVLGVLPGFIGALQATEAIKLIAGIGEPLAGRLLIWNALTMESQTLALQPDPEARKITELPPDDYGQTCEIDDSAIRNPQSAMEETGVGELRQQMASGATQLVDCREEWERVFGTIEPSIHVPLSALAQGQAGDDLRKLNPQKPTVVYCAVGVRSLHAARLLRERHGFRSAVSLHGGIRAWQESGNR